MTRRRILLHAASVTVRDVFPATCGVSSPGSREGPVAPSGHWYIRRRPDSFAGSSAVYVHAHSEGVDDAWHDPAARPRLGLDPRRAAQLPCPIRPSRSGWRRSPRGRSSTGRCSSARRTRSAAGSPTASHASCRPAPPPCSARTPPSTSSRPTRRIDDPAPRAQPPAAAPTTTCAEPEFHPKLTFDQFVIGDANRFAHAAALAVAELPGQAYNPLFLYGPPGLGKTHLLHAIGNYIQEHGAGLRVRSTTAERFTNEFVAALQTRDIEDFKARFRDTDVLLIDDVQFLQRKAKTEEEFFHTFNALHETGSQLVLTCDRLPADMAALEARLLERFQSGLVAELTPPDLATRLAILRKRVQHDGIELADEGALHAIAHRDHLQRPRARGRPHPRRRLPLAHAPPDRRRARRRGPRRHVPPRPAAPAPRSRSSACRSSRARPSPSRARSSSPARATPASPGRARSPCTSPASTPARPCPRSAASSAAATTRPSCTPAGAAGERIASDPAAKAAVSALEHRLAGAG